MKGHASTSSPEEAKEVEAIAKLLVVGIRAKFLASKTKKVA